MLASTLIKPFSHSLDAAPASSEPERESAPVPWAALRVALDLLGTGFALLDAQTRVAYANAAARAALASLDTDGASELRWRRALREAATSTPRRALLQLGAEDSARHAALIPFDAGGTRWLVALFGDACLCGPLELQMYAALQQLSYAESQVLSLLSLGHRAEAIARHNGVAVSTVRTQLASLRAKASRAGVHEMMDVLARLPRIWCTHGRVLRG